VELPILLKGASNGLGVPAREDGADAKLAFDEAFEEGR
jgi:hypothetical protein